MHLRKIRIFLDTADFPSILARMEHDHVISALRRKRAELAGLIPEAERRLASLREAVASIDVTIRLFDPGADPEKIKPRRTYKRRSGFARRELPRLVADEVRKASGPLSAHAIAALVAAGRGIDDEDAIAKQVSATLNGMHKRGAVVRTGENGAALWRGCRAADPCTADAGQVGRSS